MFTPYSAHSLQTALALLDRFAFEPGVREMTALGHQVADWLAPDAPRTPARDGETPEPGHPLWHDGRAAVWLLPGGRLRRYPDDPSEEVETVLLGEAAFEPARMAEELRPLVFTAFLGHVALADLAAALVPTVVNEVFAVLPEVGPDSRRYLVRALVAGMRPGDGWDRAVARLKTGLERSLSDHEPGVVAAAADGLVRLAAGLGPRPPVGDPSRGIVVLFAMPRIEVRRATLQALADLPEEALLALRPVLEGPLRTAVADADADTRRLAGRVQRRVSGGGALADLADAMESSDTAAAVEALSELGVLADADAVTLLPSAIVAGGHDDRTLRAAAMSALGRLADRGAAGLRRAVVLELLGSPTDDLIALGLTLVGADAGDDDRVVTAAIQAVLDGPSSQRALAAERMVDRYFRLEVPALAAGLEAILRHDDPEVRRVALRRLAHEGGDRVALREAAFPLAAAHLDDPAPELRVEAALTLVELRYPNAAGTALQLAYDPDPVVRRSLAYVVGESGDARAAAEAERIVGLVDRLFDLASTGRGDDRVHWKAALDGLTAEPGPRVPDLLAALLAEIPADSDDPFLGFAADEVIARLVALTEGGEALVTRCRHLLAPPRRQAAHAARLAGAVAAQDPVAFDLLWTLFWASEGADRHAARRALVDLADRPRSEGVRRAIDALTVDPSDADAVALVRTLKGGRR